MKDVLISICSLHDYGTEDEDSLEFTTDGNYFFEDGIGCLTYMESEVTGLEGTRTSLMAFPDRIVVDRDGMVTSRMTFRTGQKTSFQYSTPYGSATLSVYTRSIERRLDEKGGSITIEYVMDVEHVTASRNRFYINVRETEKRA